MARILVVEDRASFRTALALRMRGQGHEVIEAARGDEALELVRSRAPDLVLLDLSMPGVDGVGFLEGLARDGGGGGARVMVVTAASDAAMRGRVLGLGAYDYLVKSRFSLCELVERVEACLRRPAGGVAVAAGVAAAA